MLTPLYGIVISFHAPVFCQPTDLESRPVLHSQYLQPLTKAWERGDTQRAVD